MDNDTGVTIPPQQEDTAPVYMQDQTLPTVLPDAQTADVRAQKGYIGFGDATQQSLMDIKSSIQSGDEKGLREKAAAALNYQNQVQKEQKILDMRKAKGSPLTLQEYGPILDPFDFSKKEASPDDVVEKAYANKFITMASTANSFLAENVMDRGTREVPEVVQQSSENASVLKTKMEIARTAKENAESEIKQQSYLGWGWDQAKTLLQPYNEYMLRGVNPEVSKINGGLLLGDNMKAQADELFMRDIPGFKKGLQEAKEALKSNPTLYSQFLDYVIGVSTSERHLQNLFTVLSPMDYAQGFNLSKSLLRKVDMSNRVNNGFKQIIKESAKDSGGDIPVKAVAQEAMGDVHGAAVTRAADDIARGMEGRLNPVQTIKEDFTSGMRLDGDLIDSRPGSLSRSQLIELRDSFYNQSSDLYNRIVNMLRVNRTPVSLASEEALKAYQAAARGLFPGENILDIGSPIHMPETNTYHIPFTFGNAEGRLLGSEETAANYARIRGWQEARVLPATGEVERVPGQAIGTKTDLATQARLQKNIPITERFLQGLKDRVSKNTKFIGPQSPEQIAGIKETIESTKGILDKMKNTLENVSKKIKVTDPVVEQHGVGYKIVVIRPYRETDDIVRKFLLNDSKALSTSSQTGWSSWKNAALGWVRSADDTLAYNESMNRKIATYTQTVIKEWAKKEAENIEAIANQTKWYTPWTWHRKFTRKEMFDQFNDTLKFAKSAKDPKTGDPGYFFKTPGELGYFFKTPGELEDHYQRYYQRIPSFAEQKAYFSHVKLLEANRVLSEIAEFRNRARLGAEQHQIFMLAPDGTRKGSDFFDGIQRTEMPRGGGLLLKMGEHEGDEKLGRLGASDFGSSEYKKMEEALQKGTGKIIELYDVDHNPLSEFSKVAGTNRVRYVFTTDSEFKPLGFNHVNRRGGGHFDVDSDFYVKQAHIRDETIGDALSDKRRDFKRVYVGDKTLMPIGNRVMGADVAKKMTEMNTLMREGRTEEAKALSAKLGIEWDTMQGWYNKDQYYNGKKIGARIDWDEPFYVVPRNRRIYDLHKELEDRIGKENFIDGSKSGSLALQFQVEYNQARDSELMHTLQDVGSQGNPIYKMVQADYVDPIPSLNRALNRAIRSTFMDDYKIHAVEHWLQEAIPHMKEDREVIRAAPFYYFNNADYGAFKSGTDAATISNLLSNRLKINQFVGMPNVVETYTHGLTQLLVDEFYKRFGPEEERNFLQKAVTVVPLWALSKWQDPVSGIRSFAFNAKLGVFAVPQFLVQAQTFANIWAIGGRHGAAGTFASMLHQWSRVNRSEKFMQAYDDLYSKLNVFGSKAKPGEFIEANNELAKSGFEHVGGEYQLADDQMQHRFIKNEFNNFLDAGQVFFREGEKATRLGAYYTAFREFRAANPTKVLTDADRASILQKADLYTANMSRASASSLNSSILSLPMQFLTYQVRMAELFWGKRLGETAGQRAMARARLMGMYAALYGAPGAIGVTGYPFLDSIREEAINRGYVPGDNQFYDSVMNGLVAWQLAMISGEGDYKKGNQYDIQGRYGTQGLQFFQEAMRSDKPVWKLLGGAGLDTLSGTIGKVLDPFWGFARQLVSDDEEGNTFKLTPSHFTNMFSEISSVDLSTRFIYALHSGRWVDRNERYIEDVTGKDALFRAITGVKSQEQTDMFLMKDIKSKEEAVHKEAEREITKDYQRGLDAVKDKSYDQAQTYFSNARARMIAVGIPIDRRTEIMANATRNYEAQTMTSEWKWATKNVPHGEEATRIDALQRRLQIQKYRNQ